MITRNRVIAAFMLVTLFFGASVAAEVVQIGENIQAQAAAKYNRIS